MNNDNLIPLNKRTKAEQRAIQSKGGRKSGEIRRRRADIRDIVLEFLAMPIDGGGDMTDISQLDSLQDAAGSGLSVAERIVLLAIRDALDEKSSPDKRAKARDWLIEAAGGFKAETEDAFSIF